MLFCRTVLKGLTPIPPMPLPLFRQPFVDQLRAHALAAACHDAQVAAILVLITVDRLKVKSIFIEQAQQAHLGALAQTFFRRAAGIGNFRRVDIRDADLAPFKPECIAIDHAIGAGGAKANAKASVMRVNGSAVRGGRPAAEPDGSKQGRTSGEGNDGKSGPANGRTDTFLGQWAKGQDSIPVHQENVPARQ